MNDSNEHIDDLFKNGLDGIAPTPPNSNWQKIANQLEGEELDAYVADNLNKIEVDPQPEIWNNIKKKLPLSLLVRNQLNWLSGIAAALVIFMVAVLLLNPKETITTNTPIAQSEKTTTPLEITPLEEEVDFVFAIEEDKKTTSASEELSLEDEKTIEDFWSFVMDDDEDFVVDEALIEKSLEPILPLPVEDSEAYLPENLKSLEPVYEFSQEPMFLPEVENFTIVN